MSDHPTDNVITERNAGFADARQQAAALVCQYCAGIQHGVEYEPAKLNKRGVPVHRVYSSRGLGSDHECRAWHILELKP